MLKSMVFANTNWTFVNSNNRQFILVVRAGVSQDKKKLS